MSSALVNKEKSEREQKRALYWHAARRNVQKVCNVYHNFVRKSNNLKGKILKVKKNSNYLFL
jgi:hypothetical protein